jgi:transposase
MVYDLIFGVLVVGGMRKRDPQPWLVDDDLWTRIEPLIPKQQQRSAPGRRPVDDRKVLRGILLSSTPASAGNGCPTSWGSAWA